MSQIFPHISESAMEKAVLGRVPKQFVELNKKAFQAGVEAAQAEIKKSSSRGEKRYDEV
jgi:Pyruvate/2-oxoacid:ferredoxin oxidoreductase gamma subunit